MVPWATSLVMEVLTGPAMDAFQRFIDGSDVGCEKH